MPDPIELPGLTELEIASGVVCGVAQGRRQATRRLTPTEALEEEVLRALRRTPCFVSFSGGFDSSAVLGAAVRVARREGLAAPVPISWRFAQAPCAYESEWQERVIAELGVGEWVKLEGGPELELVGEVALRTLRRHGLLYPANAFLHVPLLEQARGGSLLTGVGGDELLGRWQWRALADARAGRRRLEPRDAVRLAAALAPVARRLARLRGCERLPWLRSPAARAVRHAQARELAGEPTRWDLRVRWQADRRRLALGLRSLRLLAADAGVSVVSPLAAPAFVRALARAGGRDGFGDRLATLEATLPSLVPRALLARRRKSTFQEVFFAEQTRAFVRAWNGDGVNRDIVDVGALRMQWQAAESDLRTALLVQQVALAAGAHRQLRT